MIRSLIRARLRRRLADAEAKDFERNGPWVSGAGRIIASRRFDAPFPPGVLPGGSWRGEPAAGAWWKRLVSRYHGWAAWGWNFELFVAPGYPEPFAFCCRQTAEANGGLMALRGLAVSHFRGHWVLAVVTPTMVIRSKGESPYGRFNDAFQLVLRP